jgi:NitT/TauT family transport system ATP-binding protein
MTSSPIAKNSTDVASAQTSPAFAIEIEQLCVSFQAGSDVLSGLDLKISPGEIIALVGTSGCGKSTLLRAIAGLVVPRSGNILFSGNSQLPSDSHLSFVFQDATLLPFRNVYENVRLPLELRGAPRLPSPSMNRGQPHHDTIADILDKVGLAADSHRRFPRELSGGMRMRTSIARALITDPSILLLDEPFAALDDLLRTRLNDLILELWNDRPRTILFVTHNIAEAIYLSHRIIVLAHGRVACTLSNKLVWPRNPQLRASIEFAQLYGEVSTALAGTAT